MVSLTSGIQALVSLACLITMTNAHMIMSSPVPYGKSTLNNSPLLGDGSDFPCKQRSGVYDAEGAQNNIAIGEPQTLSFIGSVVHGGGSCQVSLSTDLQPTKNSQWMVIHSIEGGCPSNVTGNLDANPAGTGAAQFQYTVPEGVEPGQYTIAWSWVNKVGNREFYMNCGPATITAAKKKRYAPAPIVRRQSSFPAMFVANLQGVDNGCTTAEGLDIEYPDAGASVEKGTIGTNFGPPIGCAGSAAQVSGGSPSAAASGDSSATTASFAAGSSSGATATVESPAAKTVSPTGASGNPGIFATGTAAASVEATSTATVVPIPATPDPATTATIIPPSSSGTSSTTEGAQTGPCTHEGEWNCLTGGASYQRCASGQWSVVMEMATGVTCTPGMSDSFSMSGKTKRHTPHARRAHKIHMAE